MFNRQLKRNIKELDLQISKLSKEINETKKDDGKNEIRMKMIENLTKIRCQLAESKVKESYTAEIISLVAGISALLLVLKYEERDVITSKAFGMLPKLFRGI